MSGLFLCRKLGEILVKLRENQYIIEEKEYDKEVE